MSTLLNATEPTAVSAEQRHSLIARQSLLLTASYGSTAIVGVAFWTLAARTVPAERLGIETAIISAITAAAVISAAGISNAFLALLPIVGTARTSLLRLGYLLVAGTALVCGLIGGVLTSVLVPGIGSPVWTVSGVALASVVWSLFVVQDPVLTAFGRVRWLLLENIPVNIAKLALLPVLAALVGTGGNPVVFATILPAGVAVFVVSGYLIPRLVRAANATDEAHEPDAWRDGHRRTFGTFAIRDGAASALNLGLFMLLPFIVTATSGAVDGAVFALCLQVSYALDIFTAGVGVSLTTNVAADQAAGPVAALRMWRRLATIVGAVAVLVVAGSPLLLWAFGETYLHHRGVLIISVLVLGALLRTTFEVWTALLRAQRRTGTLLGWTSVSSALLVTLVVTLGLADGAVGSAIGVTVTAAFSCAVGAFGLRSGLRSATAVSA